MLPCYLDWIWPFAIPSEIQVHCCWVLSVFPCPIGSMIQHSSWILLIWTFLYIWWNHQTFSYVLSVIRNLLTANCLIFLQRGVWSLWWRNDRQTSQSLHGVGVTASKPQTSFVFSRAWGTTYKPWSEHSVTYGDIRMEQVRYVLWCLTEHVGLHMWEQEP